MPNEQRKAFIASHSSSSASQNQESGSFSLDANRPSRMVSKANVITWYNGILWKGDYSEKVEVRR